MGSSQGHVVLAPDKFKGSLSAAEVARHLRTGLLRARPGIDVRTAPVADGGDGTLEAVIETGFTPLPVRVEGPTGEDVDAAIGIRGDTAVVELSEASGLRRLPQGRLDPLHASSYGTGQLVRAAIDAGAGRVILGLGGSACTDGGAGMMQALGVRLLAADGTELPRGGAALSGLHGIDLRELDPRVAATEFLVASDVDNPLLGEHGAAAVYGPQKGASPADVRLLDDGLAHWAVTVAGALGDDLSSRAGAGAAGGVGFAALAFLHGELRPGIELILQLADFEAQLRGCRLVVTGEGSLDEQSLRGKAPVGVASAAAAHRVPVLAVAGRSTLSRSQLQAAGLSAAYTLADLQPDLDRSIAEAGPLLELLGAQVAEEWLAE